MGAYGCLSTALNEATASRWIKQRRKYWQSQQWLPEAELVGGRYAYVMILSVGTALPAVTWLQMKADVTACLLDVYIANSLLTHSP